MRGNVESAREKAAKYVQKRKSGPKDENEDVGVRTVFPDEPAGKSWSREEWARWRR